MVNNTHYEATSSPVIDTTKIQPDLLFLVKTAVCYALSLLSQNGPPGSVYVLHRSEQSKEEEEAAAAAASW